MLRRFADALLALIARLAVRLATRRVEVVGRDRIPEGRPVLVVANHFNGFVDPLVVAVVLGRVPRFLAKGTLWKIVPLRPLLRFAGLIPVHRRVDGGGGAANQDSFAAADRALVAGQTVALFPEGITHDEPRLAAIRTGAARIALSAYDEGATGLVIVPVGVVFEDKVALRTRVLVRVGAPIDVAGTFPLLVDPGEPTDEANHDAVRALTALIGERLRGVTPDYDDRWQHAELSVAADVALRPEPRARRHPVALADREALAQRLARSPERDTVRSATQRYATRLHLVDTDDEDLLAHGGVVGWARRLVTAGIGLALLYGVLAPALVFSTIPAVLVALAGSQVASPVTKGTVRVLLGLVLFLATWIVVAVNAADTGLLRFAWVLYQAAALIVAVPIVELSVEWLRSTRS